MKLTRKEARALGITIDGKTPKTKKRVEKCSHQLFDAMCDSHGIDRPIHEFVFSPTRKWRFDHLFDGWLALEVQGGLFIEGRHSRGAALLKEHEKLNEAAVLGYEVLFCTPQDVSSGRIFPIIKRALSEKEESQ